MNKDIEMPHMSKPKILPQFPCFPVLWATRLPEEARINPSCQAWFPVTRFPSPSHSLSSYPLYSDNVRHLIPFTLTWSIILSSLFWHGPPSYPLYSDMVHHLIPFTLAWSTILSPLLWHGPPSYPLYSDMVHHLIPFTLTRSIILSPLLWQGPSSYPLYSDKVHHLIHFT